VYFVSLGGFDPLDQLATAMRAFNCATAKLGVSDKVTTFTASDFGRTRVTYNDGSDHAWGSTHSSRAVR
jgi:uncharacterized protein (DUF1501 family)